MMRFISDSHDIDAIILLLEILEIKTHHEIIIDFKEDAERKLKKILKKEHDASWLIMLLLQARKKAVEDSKKIIY